MAAAASVTEASGGAIIARLAQDDVNRVCSGQVITHLSTAIKELVENALDAGATSVDVRLTEYGAECIEVADNGSGIKSEDYRGVTAKSWTSKISTFADIYRTSSFGFRGEALAALCELSDSVVVTTRTSSDDMGSQLTYNRGGALIGQSPAARPVGTTVRVLKVFSPLPVRHREFLKSLKKQFAKALTVLHSYAMVSTRVRMSVTNTVTGSSSSMAEQYSILAAGAAEEDDAAGTQASRSGAAGAGRKTLLSTSGPTKLADAIVEVMGFKFFATLAPVRVDLNDVRPPAVEGDEAAAGPAAEPTSMPASSGRAAVATDDQCMTGFVSKMGEGVGKSNNERQFVYLNGRPVDAPRVLKALNDVWRGYDLNSKPACVLLLHLRSGMFDINLTPDKREILLVNETVLLERLQAALTALWEPSRSTFKSSPMMAATLPFEPRARTGYEPTQPATMASSASSSAASASPEYTSPVDAAGVPSPDASLHAAAPVKTASTVGSIRSDASAASAGSVNQPLRVPSMDASPPPQPPPERHHDSASTASEVHSSPAVAISSAAASPAVDDNGVQQRRAAILAQLTSGNAAAGGRGGQGRKSIEEAVRTRRDPPQAATRVMQEQSPAARMEQVVTASPKRPRASPARVVPAPPDRSDSAATLPLVDPAPGDAVEDAPPRMHAGKKQSRRDESSTQPEADEASVTPAPAPRRSSRKRMMAVDEDAILAYLRSGAEYADMYVEPSAADLFPFLAAAPTSPAHADAELQHAHAGHSHATSNAIDIDAAPVARSAAAAASVGAAGEDAAAAAEESLSRVLRKADFIDMAEHIVGQFNVGFIVAGVRSDVFILDQHACDEKHQFELLRENTIIHEQRLLVPRGVDLTPSEELIVSEHLNVFRKNGFHFVIDESAPAGRRVQLTAVPFSKKTQFGDEDVRELASILVDTGYTAAAPGEAARPMPRIPKALSMFASRACRSAVMIGDALNRDKMRRIVAGLAALEQPWNCPHGRPTMRHLVDVARLDARLEPPGPLVLPGQQPVDAAAVMEA